MKEENCLSRGGKIDDYVKHFFREHNPGGGSYGEYGNGGTKTELQRYSDGSNKYDGRSVCGIVIKAIDREDMVHNQQLCSAV